MLDILEIGIGNAVVAGVMAIVACAVTRVWRNHYLAHGLWVLVLLKLVTPPLWDVSIPVAHLTNVVSQTSAGDLPANDHALSQPLAEAYIAEAPVSTNQPLSASTIRPSRETGSSWRSAVVLCWVAGSVMWIAIVAFRITRFTRTLKTMVPATPELVRTAELVAKRLKLRTTPPIRLTNAVVGPLVWPVAWRPVVVLPQQLAWDLDEHQLETIIAHEFAHLRRHDHWVRFLEVVVTSIYWWNPVVWLARRQLHAAEEACCDAEVLRLFPTNAAAYGDALLRTVEFTSSGRVPAPALSSGFGSCSLKRRVEMILNNNFGNTSAAVRFVLIAIAVSVLPWTAAVAEEEKKEDSLEQRVGRIEKLLERLIERQEAQAKLPDRKVKQDPGKVYRAVEVGPVETGRINTLAPNQPRKPGNILAVPHITDGPASRLRTDDRPQAHKMQQPDTPIGRYRYSYQSTGVDSMIQAIKKKQADIKRLEMEIEQIRKALGPETSAAEPSPSYPATY